MQQSWSHLAEQNVSHDQGIARLRSMQIKLTSRRDSSLLISAFLLCFHCVEPELPLSEGGSRTPVPNSSKATPIAKDIRRLWTVTPLTSNTARGKEEKMATLDT